MHCLSRAVHGVGWADGGSPTYDIACNPKSVGLPSSAQPTRRAGTIGLAVFLPSPLVGEGLGERGKRPPRWSAMAPAPMNHKKARWRGHATGLFLVRGASVLRIPPRRPGGAFARFPFQAELCVRFRQHTRIPGWSGDDVANVTSKADHDKVGRGTHGRAPARRRQSISAPLTIPRNS